MMFVRIGRIQLKIMGLIVLGFSVIGKEITHGRLNSSGLSIADCSYMREYFVEAINNLEKK